MLIRISLKLILVFGLIYPSLTTACNYDGSVSVSDTFFGYWQAGIPYSIDGRALEAVHFEVDGENSGAEDITFYQDGTALIDTSMYACEGSWEMKDMYLSGYGTYTVLAVEICLPLSSSSDWYALVSCNDNSYYDDSYVLFCPCDSSSGPCSVPDYAHQLTNVCFQLADSDSQDVTANFSASPTSGDAPLTVTFTDTSTGSVDTWSWDFGDGSTSSQQTPTHVYEEAGTYTVSLTVSGDEKSDTMTLSDHIVVTVAESDLPNNETKLTASDGEANDSFGNSVAMFGDYAIVGAYNKDGENTSGSGAAYIYQREADSWAQTQKLTANDGDTGDNFGNDVAISGDYAIVGAYYKDAEDISYAGAAYIFKRSGTTWNQVQKLIASDGQYGDAFGASVAISDGYAFVSAPVYVENSNIDYNGSNSGSVYIFKRTGDTWTEVQKLTASDAEDGDNFGCSVAISQGCAIIGAQKDEDYGFMSGSAYIFRLTDDTWIQEQKLTAGQCRSRFGNSVAISGDYAIVGAFQDNSGSFQSGSAYIFQYTGDTWVQIQKLTAGDAVGSDYFGGSVAISGGLAIVGASHVSTGAAYIFKRTDSTWNEEKLTGSDAEKGDNFGNSIAISGGYAIIGATGDSDNGNDSGSAYIYEVPENYSDAVDVVADFSASPTSGYAPLTVTFSDSSTGSVDTWSWNFGDGSTSSLQNSTHTFESPGKYTVSLTVSGVKGSDTYTGSNLIMVESLPDSVTGYQVLKSDSGMFTIHHGEYIMVYGSGDSDMVYLESGARAECLNFSGSTVISEDNTSGFTVFRSGAVVTLQNSTSGTLIRIPASTTEQTLIFGQDSYKLFVRDSEVLLGEQVVTTTAVSIDSGSDVYMKLETRN